ncbi:MAG: DUF1700 domain-containing protein [Cellulosilyticaceae bacterium]
MSKNEFMNELVGKLDKLPVEERHAAINYYEEYFEEAGAQNEEEAIKNLGDPKTIAKQILGDFALKEAERSVQVPKKKSTSFGMIILAILAAPIALPLAIALIALIGAGVITIGAIIFSLGLMAVSLLIVGILALGGTVPLGIGYPPTGFFAFGVGLACIGLAMLIGMLLYYLVIRAIPRLIRTIDSHINKKKAKELKL